MKNAVTELLELALEKEDNKEIIKNVLDIIRTEKTRKRFVIALLSEMSCHELDSVLNDEFAMSNRQRRAFGEAWFDIDHKPGT